MTDQNLPEPNRDWRSHDFWPSADVLEAIPVLYDTESVGERDKIVHLHYFAGGSDWWVVELDPFDRLALGYACLGDPQMAEWGYIPLDELAQMFLPPRPIIDEGTPGWTVFVAPIVVERDLHWTPRTAGEVIPYL